MVCLIKHDIKRGSWGERFFNKFFRIFIPFNDVNALAA